MAAGLGFKTFTTGEVLTAADTNGYLMQGVLVFASSAARAAAITSPQEGQYSYLKDTNSTEYYDGAAWIAAPIGDITGVTAGTGISGGGTSGTVTITNSMATEIAAKGDLIVGTGAATFDNLTVGANGTTLVADSSTATGLKWATPATTGFVGARVYKSASQAITTATFTEVSWDTEAFDTDGFHDNATNNNRFTIPAGKAGYYRVEYQLQPYNTTENYWKLMKNGSTVYSGDYAQVGGTTGQVWFSYVASLAVADYISFQYAQYTGVNKNIQATGGSYAQIQYLGA